MQPEPRRRNNVRTVIIVVVAVLVVCCGGAAAAGYTIYQVVDNSTAPMREAATDFLDDLKAANYETAYNRLCGRTRDSFSQAEFIRTVSERPVSGFSVNGFSVENSNGFVDGVVKAEITFTGYGTEQHSIPMLADGDTWYVCGNPY